MGPTVKKKTDTAKQRTAIAKKAWVTRRRRTAALKAWKTRRSNEHGSGS